MRAKTGAQIQNLISLQRAGLVIKDDIAAKMHLPHITSKNLCGTE